MDEMNGWMGNFFFIRSRISFPACLLVDDGQGEAVLKVSGLDVFCLFMGGNE